jgi:hypothetical protein
MKKFLCLAIHIFIFRPVLYSAHRPFKGTSHIWNILFYSELELSAFRLKKYIKDFLTGRKTGIYASGFKINLNTTNFYRRLLWN